MTVKQMSIFLENKTNQLAELTNILNANGIDMQALALAETTDFGILRLIVNDTYTTSCLLKDNGYVFSITPVLAVAIPDEPGGLSKVLDVLGTNEINIEYAYAFTSRVKDVAYMIFRVEDNDKARDVLRENGIKLLTQEKLNEL